MKFAHGLVLVMTKDYNLSYTWDKTWVIDTWVIPFAFVRCRTCGGGHLIPPANLPHPPLQWTIDTHYIWITLLSLHRALHDLLSRYCILTGHLILGWGVSHAHFFRHAINRATYQDFECLIIKNDYVRTLTIFWKYRFAVFLEDDVFISAFFFLNK